MLYHFLSLKRTGRDHDNEMWNIILYYCPVLGANLRVTQEIFSRIGTITKCLKTEGYVIQELSVGQCNIAPIYKAIDRN